MTRDEVQEQFGAAPDDGGPNDRMADEIVRLRKELDEQDTARITAELLLERERRTSESHFGMSVMYEKEYERARDILAALREPSETVISKVWEELIVQCTLQTHDPKSGKPLKDWICHEVTEKEVPLVIRAAVEAAEQEASA